MVKIAQAENGSCDCEHIDALSEENAVPKVDFLSSESDVEDFSANLIFIC